MRLALGLGLIVLTLALLFLIPGQEPILGIERDALARGTVSVCAALLASGWILRAFRGRVSKALEAIAAWLMITVALVAGYTYRFELADIANRVLGSLAPGLAIGGRGGEVVVTRSGSGTFPMSATVNGLSAQFLFDTGASSVVIRYEEAARLGIALAPLEFNISVSTANGAAMAAPVTLESVSIGTIRLTNVRALVSSAGTLRENLLGHSFLSRLSSYTVEGDRLILRGRAF